MATGPVVLRVKFVHYDMQGWILEFWQTLKKEPLYFTHAIKSFIHKKQVQFFILSGNLLLRES